MNVYNSNSVKTNLSTQTRHQVIYTGQNPLFINPRQLEVVGPVGAAETWTHAYTVAICTWEIMAICYDRDSWIFHVKYYRWPYTYAYVAYDLNRHTLYIKLYNVSNIFSFHYFDVLLLSLFLLSTACHPKNFRYI